MKEEYSRFLSLGQQVGAGYGLALPRHVPWGLEGARLGQRSGNSLEFREHREYQPGDDLRRIDWSAYARTDRLHIKLFREEVTPHMDLLLDGSRSMDLPGSSKATAAVAMSALLASAAEQSRVTRRLWLAGAGCLEVINGARSPDTWSGLDFDFAGSPAQSLAQSVPPWRSRSVRILISDLLWLGEPMEVLRPLSRGAAVMVVIQLLAAADVEPPQAGSVRLVDSETGRLREVFIDETARQRYRQALALHQKLWRGACARTGATMVTLVAEDLLSQWDLRALVEAEILKPA